MRPWVLKIRLVGKDAKTHDQMPHPSLACHPIHGAIAIAHFSIENPDATLKDAFVEQRRLVKQEIKQIGGFKGGAVTNAKVVQVR